MTRWKVIIEYDGTPFAGWQRQDEALSVQQVVEEAITKFCQQEIRVHAAGRTDAGVHAAGQIAHFDLDYGDRALTGHDLAKAINAYMLSYPVSIVTAEEVADDFHARFGAKNKLYLYRVLNRSAPPALDQNKFWHKKRPLDVAAMNDAAAVLVGHHDFTSFRATDCQSKNPVKTLNRSEVEGHDYGEGGGQEIRFYFEGRSFLHHQVRNMVGTLTMVGEGKWTKQDVKAALEAKDRKDAGPTAPPQGLSLIRIDYEYKKNPSGF